METDRDSQGCEEERHVEPYRGNLHTIITQMKPPDLYEHLELFVEGKLDEFKIVLEEHPIQQPRTGHCSVSEGFWLYCMAQAIQPECIVESGSLALGAADGGSESDGPGPG